MLQSLPGAVQTLGVGGGDHVPGLYLPGAVHVDGVVWTEGVPCVGGAVVTHDAAQSVHCSQVETILFDLKTICVQLATRLQDLQITVSLDVKVVEDEEHYLLLVDLVVDGSLDPLVQVRVKLGVVFPDLLGSVH